jgi:hypothetical protein
VKIKPVRAWAVLLPNGALYKLGGEAMPKLYAQRDHAKYSYPMTAHVTASILRVEIRVVPPKRKKVKSK